MSKRDHSDAIHGRFSVKVYYEDTDSLGMVYYANYFKYLERARTELIDGGDRPIAEWNRLGYLFVVYRVDATFLAPARLGDNCDVLTTIREQRAYRTIMDQRIVRGDDLLLNANVHIVCVDRDLQLREMPAALPQST